MFTVNLVGPRNGATAAEAATISQITQVAGAYWARYIDFSNATIEIDLLLERDDPAFLAFASPVTFVDTGRTFQGAAVMESQVAVELRDGIDPNGADADIEIGVNTRVLRNDDFFLVDFDTFTIDTLPRVPNGQIDLFGTLLHEIGHGLGLFSMLEEGNGEVAVMDEQITLSGNRAFFNGAQSQAVFGGPVPLASRNDRSHFNDDLDDLLDAFAPDDGRSLISALDVAFFDDIGLPVIRATGGADTLYGFATDDTIISGNGDDTVFVGDGDDVVAGQGGRDLIFGGNGDDSLRGLGSNDTLLGEAGRDALSGGNGKDTVDGGSGNDIVSGNDGNDRVFGGSGDDSVFGGSGDDGLRGGGGNDDLFGGEGDDRLSGNSGTDRLSGGAGIDVLIGGGGNDTFIYRDGDEADRIIRFQNDRDTLSLDEDLWGGGLTAAQVVDTFASDTGGAIVFDFGGGNTLSVSGPGVNTGTIDDDIAFL